MDFQRYSGNFSRFLGILGFSVAVLFAIGPGALAAGKLRGNYVCTRVDSVIEVHRIPIPGTKTQMVRYTTICGLQGRCSRYRIMYVQNYRESTRTTYRVVQECCAGWMQQGRRCVAKPSPDTAGGSVTTTAPAWVTTKGTTNHATAGPSKQPVARPDVTTDHGAPGADGVGVTKREREGRRRQEFDATPPQGGQGKVDGGVGHEGGVGRDTRTKTKDADGTAKTKNDEGVLQNGAENDYPQDGKIDPAKPDVQQPQKNSGMMFMTGMLSGVGVLSVAVFVILFMMYRQRRHVEGRIIGIPFFQSTRSGSGSFRKSKLLSLAQSIKAGEVKLLWEQTAKGKGKTKSPYADIEEVQTGVKFSKYTESLPVPTTNNTTGEEVSLEESDMVALKPSSSWTRLQNERQLPPKPPTYAVIQRVSLKRKAPGVPGNEEERASSVKRASSIVYAIPDNPKGTTGIHGHTMPRDFNMGPPRYILCESQHIYADIQRKSKASAWSWYKNARPKSSASDGDMPRQEDSTPPPRALRRSLSRNSLRKIIKRSSNADSSGYSSLGGSRENICDNYESVEERSSPPTPNIYTKTTPKDAWTSDNYDRLDLAPSDSYTTEYDKLSRGPKAQRSCNGIVKTFSKKYEKLASMSKR